MKRGKIVATILTLCLAISTLAYGVYAANNLNFTIGANIAFEVDNLFLSLEFDITGAYYTYNGNLYSVDFPKLESPYSLDEAIDDDVLSLLKSSWENEYVILTKGETTINNQVTVRTALQGITFAQDSLTPLKAEVKVRNYTPNKNLLVRIFEIDNSEDEITYLQDNWLETSSSLLFENYANYVCVPGMAYNYDNAKFIENQIAETYNQTATAKCEYQLIDLATQIPSINLNWKIRIEGLTPETSEKFTIANNSISAYSGTEEYVFLPRGITNVAEGGLNYIEDVKMFKIPYGVQSLGVSSLYETYMNFIELPESLVSIQEGTFNYSNLISLNLPASLETFAPRVELLHLRQVEVAGGTHFKVINNMLFSYNEQNLLLRPAKDRTTILQIPNSVTTIESYALCGNKYLISIYFPTNIQTIGDYAIMDCTSLTSITFPINIQSIGIEAFSNCTSLTTIDLSNHTNLVTIDDYAFSTCTSLTSITLPASLATIGAKVFDSCTTISEVIIHADSLTIDSGLFMSTNGYFKIFVPASGLNNYMTATNWTSFSSRMVGFADLTSGQALPTIPMGSYGTATWYSDKACTTVVTGTASATQRYYVKLS